MTKLYTSAVLTTPAVVELFARREAVQECSFCGAPASEHTRLMSCKSGARICSSCARLANEVLGGAV